MRECWLSENQRLVSQDNFGFDLAAVEAAAKKHEAIETDIFAYEERVQAVISVASELETEKYHDIDRINARRDNVLRYVMKFQNSNALNFYPTKILIWYTNNTYLLVMLPSLLFGELSGAELFATRAESSFRIFKTEPIFKNFSIKQIFCNLYLYVYCLESFNREGIC